VNQTELRRIKLAPHLVTGRTGKNHPGCPFLTDCLHIVINEMLKRIIQPGAQERESAAVLVTPQQCQIHTTLTQDLSKMNGNPLGQGKIGRHTAGKVNNGGLFFEKIVGWHFCILHPIRPLIIVFGKDVVALQEIFPDPVHGLGGSLTVHQILSQGYPDLLEGDTYGTCLLTVAAKGAAKNGFAETTKILQGRFFSRKDLTKQAVPIREVFFKLIQPINTGQLPV